MSALRCPPRPPPPSSCDTFVALPPATQDNTVIFGKNSDRPDEEPQYVEIYPSKSYPPGSTLQCTYITIPQAPHTHAIVVSRPAWMWGGEMAANDQGVVIGNEAVWTKVLNEREEGRKKEKALLGMDLVRIVAERADCAVHAVDILTEALTAFGQGGSCSQHGWWTYHNSFLIADSKEAWVVETAGRWWVAERVAHGVRNISNCLSIRSDFDRYSPGLFEYVKERGYWDGRGRFDWASAMSSSPVPSPGRKQMGRERAGLGLMVSKSTRQTKFNVEDMMDVLRDVESGICMCADGGGFRSNASQVSILYGSGTDGDENAIKMKKKDIHWFTGTPDPSVSCFKPIVLPTPDEPDGNLGSDPQIQRVCDKVNELAPRLWDRGDSLSNAGTRNVDALREIEQDLLRQVLDGHHSDTMVAAEKMIRDLWIHPVERELQL